MASTKEIQRRIKSVANTKKITKAMEMVAASKMRKAVEAVMNTRTYANLSWNTVINLSNSLGMNGKVHPLLSKNRAVKKVGIVLMTSNRGLCGGFNSNVIRKAHNSILKHHFKNVQEVVDTEFIVVGKKGYSVHTRYGYKVIAEFPKLDIVSEVNEVRAIANLVIGDYLSGRYDKVMVAFTDYVNTVKQEPRIKQLLPIDIQAAKDHGFGIMGSDTRVGLDEKLVTEKKEKYLSKNFVFSFEPGADEVLEAMVPRLIEVQLFQALLESNASEHSARMSSMHQATDAAEDMKENLVLFYNKARQAGITSEIAEISAGAAALNA